jgi:hypothetical protein
MVAAMKKASGRELPYVFAPRREGDIAVCYADPTKAKTELGWVATRGLDDMCKGKLSKIIMWMYGCMDGYGYGYGHGYGNGDSDCSAVVWSVGDVQHDVVVS